MSVFDILNDIASTPSKNEKQAILESNKDNQLLKDVLERTYSPLIRYGINIETLPKVIPSSGENKNLEDSLVKLDRISSGEVRGNAARALLVQILSDASEEVKTVIWRIIDKSQKLGCSTSTINKGMGRGTIKEAAYQGAVSYDLKKVNALFQKETVLMSQHKLDGRFANMVILEGDVSCESRQGLPADLGNIFDNVAALESHLGSGALNGELLIRGYEKKREAGNGIVNALISIAEKVKSGEDVEKDVKKFMKVHTLHPDEFLSQVYFVVWDFIPLQNYSSLAPLNAPYQERFEALCRAIEECNLPNVETVNSRIVNSPEEAKAHFLELLAEGMEGTILKSMTSGWKKGKPSYQIKFKVELDFDLKITGGNYGAIGTKNEGKISSLNVESSCGKLISSPGGFSETDIEFFTENLSSLIGSIVTVKCYGISKGRNKDTYALSHASVVCVRSDKTEADTLELILETFESAKTLG